MNNIVLDGAKLELTSKLVRKLIDLISSSAEGELDGLKLGSISLKASGRRFVVKGWVDKELGPAVRFTAPWGDLQNGFMWYQATPEDDWEDVEETGIELDFDWSQVMLTVSFTLNGTDHTAVFTGTPS